MENWPFDYELTIFGQDLSASCGTLSVRFINIADGLEVDFITFDQETEMVTLVPDLTHAISVTGIKMQVYLTDYQSVIEEQAFIVKIEGTDNCIYDRITFKNNIGDLTYTFSNPENTLTHDPEVNHSVANCPQSCKFYENTAELTLPNDFVVSVSEQTGSVSFASSKSHLDGSAFPMLIVCESLESELTEDKRIAFDRFAVNF